MSTILPRRPLRALHPVLLLSVLLLFAACHAPTVPGLATAPRVDGGWTTLRAQHHVRIETASPDGPQRRELTAVVAVARPDRFRLRMLGPGGITVVDVLSVAGKVDVVFAMRGAPRGSPQADLLASVAGDLAAAFDLAPRPAGRTLSVEKGVVVVREPSRTVRLSEFRAIGASSYPSHIEVDDGRGRYRVVITASDTVLDEPLDPALFTPPVPSSDAPPAAPGPSPTPDAARARAD